ncbi:MAG: hypothetical protein ABIK07_16535 [Planctomycetota bacterium]|jgi:hypothetical protein|uniref:hypothetical protein n=1 Tax=uncultured Gimesia sp. TaxID=1678688 RepID=UPI0026355FF1|nr:hypothetical protein [uncultured Gimesia sp.]
MNVPLFAADIIGIIFGIIFVIISVVSALSNMAKEKNKPQPGKLKQKAALQQELEKFLQEAINPQQKEKPAEVNFFEEEDAKVENSVQQPPQRLSSQQEMKQPQKEPPQKVQSQQPRSQRAQQPKPKRKPVAKPAQTKAPKQHISYSERAEINAQERQERLGGALREHIEKQQKTHRQSKIHDHLGTSVNKHVTSTFSSREDKSKDRASSLEGVKVIRALIKNPQSLRQAIILNEILSPPKIRRRS